LFAVNIFLIAENIGCSYNKHNSWFFVGKNSKNHINWQYFQVVFVHFARKFVGRISFKQQINQNINLKIA